MLWVSPRKYMQEPTTCYSFYVACVTRGVVEKVIPACDVLFHQGAIFHLVSRARCGFIYANHDWSYKMLTDQGGSPVKHGWPKESWRSIGASNRTGTTGCHGPDAHLLPRGVLLGVFWILRKDAVAMATGIVFTNHQASLMDQKFWIEKRYL